MSVVNNLVGKRVFKSGSAAPNRGSVSAQGALGYLRREQGLVGTPRSGPFGGTSKWGRDGKSDTRSGRTADILGNAGNSPYIPGIIQGGVRTPPATDVHPAQPNAENEPNNPTQIPAGPTVTESSTPGLFTAPPRAVLPPSNQSPTVQINDVGTLKLPYDFKSASAVLAQKQKADADLAEMTAARQQAALAYQQNVDKTDNAYQGLRLGTLNQAAARGTAFSSGYGKKVATNATDYNTAIGDLTTKEALSRSTDENNRTRILAAFKTYLAQQALNQGYNLDARAGTLNLIKKKKAKKK